MKKELLRTFQLTLSQNGAAALSGLCFQVFAGEHSGILFNSFKERDIFLSFLEGRLAPSEGFLYFEEQVVSYQEYTRAARSNLAIVMEKSRLMDSLSIYENLFYDQLSPAWLSSRKYKSMTDNLLSYFDLPVITTQKAAALSAYERVAVELIKAFSQKKKLIFVSNISTVIDKNDFQALLRLLSILEKHGTTFIFSDTFDTQLFQLANTLHIIKNGQIIRILDGNRIDQTEIQKSLGSYLALHDLYEPDSAPDTNETALCFHSIGDHLINNLSFSLKKGGILKLFCSNSRQAEDLEALVTQSSGPTHGEISFYGQSLNQIDKHLYQKRYGLISSNPRQTSILHNMSVLDNLCLPLDRKIPGLLSSRNHKKAIAYELRELIDAKWLNQKIDEVPIDVVQKVIYCKWLLYLPELLICINPFSIVDSSLNLITRQMLTLLTGRGIPVLIIANNWSMDIEIPGETLFL